MTTRQRRALIALAAALALAGGGVAIAKADGSATGQLPQAQPAVTGSLPGTRPTSPAAARTAVPKPSVTRSQAIAGARAEARRNATAIKSASTEKYQAVDTVVDPGGERHVRFHRTHRGLPVLGGDFVVHTDASGRFSGATLTQQRVIDVPRTAKVSRERAIEAAGLRGRAQTRRIVDALDGEPALAWEVTGGTKVVIVDAMTGRIRLSYDTVHTGEQGTGHGLHVGDVELSTTRRQDGSYTLVDPEHGGNTVSDALNTYHGSALWRSAEFSDADNVWGDGTRADRATVAVDVLYGMARTWDYLRDTFGRTGLFGDRAGVTAYVHHDVDENNASWSSTCKCMTFGDGGGDNRAPYTTLDVVGHEMAHGLTDATADLIYRGESGGLNEASSDIFGTLVEFHVDSPVDTPDYTVSEKTRLDGTPSRWMDEPSKDGKSLSCWTPTAKDLDVHHSSGIGNKFFYNLAVGSGASRWGDSRPCGDAPPVTGLGNDRAAQIWYRALSLYMVSNTNYAGAREATLRAAADLYGAGSTEQRTVDAAWLAAGVSSAQVPNGAPVMAPLPDRVVVPKVGEPVRLQVSARDPQQQELTFSATGLPPGVSIDAHGLITGAPTTRAYYTSTITATDPDGNSDSKETRWVVKGPVTLRSATPQLTETLGPVARLTFQATFADTPDHWADKFQPLNVTTAGVPDGMLLTVEMADLGVYRVHLSGRVTAVGSGTAVLTATDPDGNQATASIPWRVLPAEKPDAVYNVTVTGRADGTALLTWERPNWDPYKYFTDGFVVRVSPGTETKVHFNDRSRTLTGLDPRKAYTIGVRPTSEAGDGPETTVQLRPAGLPITRSPAAVTHGQPVALSGRVVGGRAPATGFAVTLERRAAGTGAWTRVATLRTDSLGSWRTTVRPTATSAYRVRLADAMGLWPATSAAPWATVRYAVSAKASSAKPKAGKKITISGSVRPARAGAKVTLQRAVGGRWVTLNNTTTSAGGGYSVKRAFSRGTWKLRVVVAGGTANATGTSSTLTVKVS
ncbi:M4 family metallopeptidase [Actinoplanes teichomyceticus]|uniref:Zn-dependent metalloprotease n=1 Tax=Actinoplanes teichomyceticus TaxID=1867 RepID=A0A561WIK7_ACTTI|nr:M4 family metallopeptidase [Actinoplanes teichomyceticus]TWG23717.1 Zn-dependent metalloprotease [Actinoplanes teichomyceticus]GIF11757.1 hypothetical protein Ate01nite_17890 [Actinoplanes teichomyceticus]